MIQDLSVFIVRNICFNINYATSKQKKQQQFGIFFKNLSSEHESDLKHGGIFYFETDYNWNKFCFGRERRQLPGRNVQAVPFRFLGHDKAQKREKIVPRRYWIWLGFVV
ncbi:hypothetical protein [uncultured Victivallis sp.]|uniref:hypothetical protein n=1 Tax=uncultured Victivallis sp. TaxID=354118 RepID=UPI00258F26E1|nr:hypothetical protein [uncultured Victivallis sp.]